MRDYEYCILLRQSIHELPTSATARAMFNLIKIEQKLQLTLFARSEERVDQRSEVGVSQHAMHWRQCICVNAASIDSPGHRFAARKEG
jgi:hypothetical protein